MTSVPIQNLKHISHLYTEFSHGTSCKPFTDPGLDCGTPPHALNREQFKATQEEPKRLSLSKKYSSPGLLPMCGGELLALVMRKKKYLGAQKLRKDLLTPQDYAPWLSCIAPEIILPLIWASFPQKQVCSCPPAPAGRLSQYRTPLRLPNLPPVPSLTLLLAVSDIHVFLIRMPIHYAVKH